jgi:hypothetical protein
MGCSLTSRLFLQLELLPFMAIRGRGPYLRDVLKVLAVHQSASSNEPYPLL